MAIPRLLLLLFAISLFSCQSDPASPSDKAPNLIFLLTDDQRWDAMGAMGNPIIQTPHMDAMARQGVMFRNAYVTTAICAVSRASILSGQYMRRHGIGDFASPFSPEAWAETYPARLRDAGYYMGFVGKFGVGRAESMPVETFDYWKGIPGQPVYEQTDEAGNYQHLTSILGEQIQEFIGEAPADKPFCLSVSFKAPHVQDGDPRQFLYDSAYIDLFQEVEIPQPKTADPAYWESFPDFFRTDTNEARRRWRIRFETEEKYQASVKGYYRLLYGVDVVLGELRDRLEQEGLADNTVIILMGDNGFYLGEHGLAGKWYGHEESIRVPLVLFDPRLPTDQRGQTPTEIALNIDIAPTLLSLAGLEVPKKMQGQNLLSILDGSATPWRESFYYEHLFGYNNKIPRLEGVVTPDWKYMRYIDPTPAYEQLFQTSSDPHETQNLALESAHEEQLNQMRAMYEDWKKKAE
ncbi:MAG: sulfatase [Bacteroidota bacterium]